METESGFDSVLGALEAARPEVVLTSSAERAASVLRAQVDEGRLRSGARLPEEAIARALGISRNTLREALSQLISERILERVPNRGVLIRTPTADDVRDVYRARRVIETGAIRVGRHARPQHDAMRAAVAEGQKALARGDGDAVASANQHFHRAVVAQAGSARLDVEMNLLLAEMRLVFFRTGSARQFHERYVERNGEIADLLSSGDVEAAAVAMDTYLHDAEAHLLTQFD
ncbi:MULTISPECIES: GntR family transcriptional regulator [Actinomycetes]|uniref:GntR family transcriptional regulator n=1 Tax=Actinomycetes TaxID=1760 RepID=UPI000ABEAC27|nr:MULTISPECIES: GntR family transcriptional regulator [Actinomycetes]